MKWIYLIIAIVSEVIATSALKESSGFSKLVPSIIAFIGYCSAFYFLSLVLREMSVGVAYAIWAGIGIVLIASIAFFRFGQKLDFPAIAGITLITIGVVIINIFSKSVTH
ncbi:MAG: multidrug efflux SMR transporter [Bacteroidota bacterium]